MWEYIKLEESDIPNIGNILYKIRWEREHLGQGEVAKIMNIQQAQLSNWENNKKTPELPNLMKYLHALGNGWCLAIIQVPKPRGKKTEAVPDQESPQTEQGTELSPDV